MRRVLPHKLSVRSCTYVYLIGNEVVEGKSLPIDWLRACDRDVDSVPFESFQICLVRRLEWF